MDEDDEGENSRRQDAASKQPYHKYKEIMRKLADRKIDEVLIDLDDVQQVPLPLLIGA